MSLDLYSVCIHNAIVIGLADNEKFSCVLSKNLLRVRYLSMTVLVFHICHVLILNFCQLDKHVPMHLRKKLRKELKPKAAHFEMMPARGSLAPGQRMNVQVKFMPTEEVGSFLVV